MLSLSGSCIPLRCSHERNNIYDRYAIAANKRLRDCMADSIIGHFRVVTWYMGSGLKAQNITGIRAQRKGLRAQKNGIRDHKAFEPESGIRFITRSKNLLSQYFSA